MLILCCDTATDHAVFVIANQRGHVVASTSVEHRRNLSARFFGTIDAMFETAGLSFDDIDAFAVGLGPGSFTGVRIAVTSARTLAQVTQKPIVGVCTLDIYAEALRGTHPDPTIVALLPSRRNELYVGLYGAAGQPRELFAATHAEALERLTRAADAGSLAVGGPEDARPNGLTLSFDVVDSPPVASFARLAADSIVRCPTGDAASILPIYIVSPAINQHLNPHEKSRLESK